MINDYTVDISLTSEDMDFMKKWCEKHKVTEQDICERAVTSYLDYLRDCEEYLSKEKVDGCVVIKSTF